MTLAPFFGELAHRALFVVYELRPRADGRTGTDKVPIDPLTRQPIDCHDPAARVTLDVAEFWVGQGVGHGVGYVLTEDARTFFLDLDHCRTGDAWAPYVATSLAAFPGAFVECSSSGDGIHVLGRYTGPRPLHRTRCSDLRAELYTAGRFCALTGAMGSGSILSDHTAALGALITERFPDRGEDGAADWRDGPVPEWRGPTDDAVLIDRAMRSTSARAAFGGAASFADLWLCNVDKLATAFPPQTAGQSYDGSGADLALANHLAYWTGNDCERMARLIRASKLARPKHEREDYLRGTILRACAGQTTWYLERVAAPGVPSTAAAQAAGVPHTVTGGPAAPVAATPYAFTVTFDRQGRVESTLANITHLLREGHAGNVRYDTFTDQIIVAGAPLIDDTITRIRIAFEQQKVAPPSKETVRDAIERVARENTYDSAIDWLNSLTWDGVPRVETFCSAYFGTEDTPFARSVSAYMLTAMAARVLDPGCQADMVPVFVSKQGMRKSSGVAALCPAPDYFTEIHLGEKEADLARKMRGKVLGEIADLQGLKSRDAQTIRAFITTRFDKWVPKFKEFSAIAARRLLFVGTANEKFLDDETGERRWLPLRVLRTVDVEAIVRDRSQLWAEAVAWYRVGGIQWHYAEQLAEPEHESFKVDDPWLEAVETWLAADQSRKVFTMADVLGGAILLDKARMGRTEQSRAAKILRRLGCRTERTIVAGVRAWRWVR